MERNNNDTNDHLNKNESPLYNHYANPEFKGVKWEKISVHCQGGFVYTGEPTWFNIKTGDIEFNPENVKCNNIVISGKEERILIKGYNIIAILFEKKKAIKGASK